MYLLVVIFYFRKKSLYQVWVLPTSSHPGDSLGGLAHVSCLSMLSHDILIDVTSRLLVLKSPLGKCKHLGKTAQKALTRKWGINENGVG